MLVSRLFETWKLQSVAKCSGIARRKTMSRSAFGAESLEQRTLLAASVLVVSNTLDSGAGSLRQAIEDANQSAGEVQIEFAIPNTDAGFVDADNGLSVAGADAAADVFRIQLQSALPSINNVNGQAITLDATTQVTLTGNTNPNGPEVVLDGDSLDVHGLFILSDFIAVRGFVIQNFGGNGVFVENASSVVIAGNYVGVDATGTLARPNALGVLIGGGDEVTIGGSQPGDQNLISANQHEGIQILSSAHVRIVGNRIGTDITATLALGNGVDGGTAVFVTDRSDVRIGGSSTGEGNVVSGNTFDGIGIDHGTNLVIQGNRIGTNITGTQALGNARNGISGNVVQDLRIQGNVISANGGDGLSLDTFTFDGLQSHDVIITGNFIGTNASGTAALGNSGVGILTLAINDVTIGGLLPGERNVISGNGQRGLHIWNSDEVHVIGNNIGTDISGVTAIPNGERGIYVEGSRDVEIRQNQIAFNVTEGVMVSTSQGTDNHSLRVQIVQNSIHSNGALGIDIAANIGISPNDVDDVDEGPNRQQNFPVIDDVTLSGRLLTVRYSVPSIPANSAFPLHVEFFTADGDPDAPEGRTYLGEDTLTEENLAEGFKTATFTVRGKVGTSIVATATDADGNTSEFSAAATVSNIVVTLPTSGGPFKLLVLNGELHVRRANNSEVIVPQPLSDLPNLLINGSNLGDTVTLEASLNGVFRSVRFNGRSGNDRLDAHLMNSGVTMDGGAGNDTLLGGSGGDLFQGGTENDSAQGNAGRDSLFGDSGNDFLSGGDGSDLLDGDEGNDQVDGGLGSADTVTGGLGNDVLSGGGGAGDLLLELFDGSVTMTNILLIGALGTDRLAGFERALLLGGSGNDVINAATINSPATQATIASLAERGPMTRSLNLARPRLC